MGLTVFKISFEPELPNDIAVSINVISPEMPVMGLLRYVAEPSSPATYSVSAENRKDGAWEIYENLGDGMDATPFAFDVQPDQPFHCGPARGAQAELGHDTLPPPCRSAALWIYGGET